MIVEVSVTAWDILEGERKSCEACPVALAMNRLLKPGHSVRLERKTIAIGHDRIYQGRPEHIAQQVGYYPSEVAAFIRRFDETGEMKPFTFEYEITDRVLKT